MPARNNFRHFELTIQRTHQQAQINYQRFVFKRAGYPIHGRLMSAVCNIIKQNTESSNNG